jgi:hypothetical protein
MQMKTPTSHRRKLQGSSPAESPTSVLSIGYERSLPPVLAKVREHFLVLFLGDCDFVFLESLLPDKWTKTFIPKRDGSNFLT